MSHHHTHIPHHIGKAYTIGIALNIFYVAIQAFIGWHIHSLSLLSDAGHNFLDVGTLAISLLAFRLSKSKTSLQFTYGYKKVSILISVINAIILLISIGIIGYEAIDRLDQPQPLPGFTIALIAAIGVIVNGGSAYLFYHDKDKDLNIKGAYLHLFSDALISVSVLAGGLIIQFTQLFWVDSALSLIICIVIILSTWRLLRDSLKLSIDGVPDHIAIEDIRNIAMSIDGVQDLRHIHVWAISTSEIAMTGHIIPKEGLLPEELFILKNKIKKQLTTLHITHSTLEIDSTSDTSDCDIC